MRKVLICGAVLLLAVSSRGGQSQESPTKAVPSSPQEKFPVFVTGSDDAAPVVKSMFKAANQLGMDLVTDKGQAKVLVLINCLSAKESGGVFVCMYVSHYSGANSQTFLGGGLQVQTSADLISDHFLSSILQDILERFDGTAEKSVTEALETCLMLTDSKCMVPGPLQKDLGKEALTLGQYLFKKKSK